MKKSTEKVVNKMIERMENKKLWYELGYVTFDELLKYLNKETKMFDEWKRACYFYDMLNDKEYEELMLIAIHKAEDIIDSIMYK